MITDIEKDFKLILFLLKAEGVLNARKQKEKELRDVDVLINIGFSHRLFCL